MSEASRLLAESFAMLESASLDPGHRRPAVANS
jgi:hypothetical protein